MSDFEFAICVKDEADLASGHMRKKQGDLARGHMRKKQGDVIAVKDEADLASGHKRKKQGDIIAVKPAPWNWGRKEVDEYLIVPAMGLTKQEAHDLCRPYLEDGQKEVIEDMDEGIESWVANTAYNLAGQTEISPGTVKSWGPSRIRTATHVYICIKAGTSGKAEPPWPTKVVDEKTVGASAEVDDGTARWRCVKKCDIAKPENSKAYALGDRINVNGVIHECIQVGTTSSTDTLWNNTFESETIDGTVKWKSLGKTNPATVGKRRYSIPLNIIKDGWAPGMVTTDVEDKKKVYQPLKAAKTKIDFTEKVSICKDNHKGSFKYAAKKIARM